MLALLDLLWGSSPGSTRHSLRGHPALVLSPRPGPGRPEHRVSSRWGGSQTWTLDWMHSLLFIPGAENGGQKATTVGNNRQKRNFPSSAGPVPTAQDTEQPRFSVTQRAAGLVAFPALSPGSGMGRAMCAVSPAAGFLPGIGAESTGCLWPGLQRREGGAEGSS